MQKFFSQIERKLHRFIDLPPSQPPCKNRSGIAMVCIAKNEEHFIEEWVNFHELVGVSKFYIYVNDDISTYKQILRNHIFDGNVTIIPWQNCTMDSSPQLLAYAHAITNFGSKFRWMAFLDVDEFLFPVRGYSLNEALVPFLELSGVSIPWHMFGTSGHRTLPDGLLIENFTWRSEFPPKRKDFELLQYKSIVDPSKVTAIKNSHWFYLKSNERATFNENSQQFTTLKEFNPKFAVSDKLRLNHYFTKSRSDLEKKLVSGRADRPAAPLGAKYKRTKIIAAKIENNQVEDYLIHKYLPLMKNKTTGRSVRQPIKTIIISRKNASIPMTW